MEGSQPVRLGRSAGRQLPRILSAGRFRVRGFVFLDPLQPFQPSPQIPEEDSATLMARQPIHSTYGYVFPDDAPTWVHPKL